MTGGRGDKAEGKSEVCIERPCSNENRASCVWSGNVTVCSPPDGGITANINLEELWPARRHVHANLEGDSVGTQNPREAPEGGRTNVRCSMPRLVNQKFYENVRAGQHGVIRGG